MIRDCGWEVTLPWQPAVWCRSNVSDDGSEPGQGQDGFRGQHIGRRRAWGQGLKFWVQESGVMLA